MLDELDTISKLTVKIQRSPAPLSPPLPRWPRWEPLGVMLGTWKGRWDKWIGNYSTRSLWEKMSGKGRPLLESRYCERFLKLQYQHLTFTECSICEGHWVRGNGNTWTLQELLVCNWIAYDFWFPWREDNPASWAIKKNLFQGCGVSESKGK